MLPLGQPHIGPVRESNLDLDQAAPMRRGGGALAQVNWAPRARCDGITCSPADWAQDRGSLHGDLPADDRTWL